MKERRCNADVIAVFFVVAMSPSLRMWRALCVLVALSAVAAATATTNLFPHVLAAKTNAGGTDNQDYGFPCLFAHRSMLQSFESDIDYRIASPFFFSRSAWMQIFWQGLIVNAACVPVCLIGAFYIGRRCEPAMIRFGMSELFWAVTTIAALLCIAAYEGSFVIEVVWYIAVAVWFLSFAYGIRALLLPFEWGLARRQVLQHSNPGN